MVKVMVVDAVTVESPLQRLSESVKRFRPHQRRVDHPYDGRALCPTVKRQDQAAFVCGQQVFQGAALQQLHHRHRRGHQFAHADTQGNGLDRGAAQQEEIVRHADLPALQRSLPQRAQLLFQLVRGSDIGLRFARRRRRQRLAIQFAAGVIWQSVQPHQRRRQHVQRQLPAHKGQQRRFIQRRLADVIQRQALPMRLRQHDRAAGFDRAERQRTLLDLSQLNAVAVDFHLKIHTAEELQVAVRQIAAGVAGAIKPLPQFRMVDELLFGQRRIAVIAARHAGPTDVLLSRQARRQYALMAIQHVKALMRHRLAVRHAGRQDRRFRDVVQDRPNGALGRAPGADDPAPWPPLANTRRQLAGDHLAHQHHIAQLRPLRLRRGGLQLLHQQRHH